MRSSVIARKTHKWLGLFVGLQVVLWSLSGVYMTLVHIDTIHGDHLVRSPKNSPVAVEALRDPLLLAAGGQGVRLTWMAGRPVYVVAGESGERLVGALDGRPVGRPDEAAIRTLAAALYTGREPIRSATLVTTIPGEIRGRKPPLWRVEFAHWNRPTLYLSPLTGELVARRHELWRVFDIAWMLHIMDYSEREDVNNPLLRVATVAALLLALSGGWMMVHAFPRKRRKGEGAHP